MTVKELLNVVEFCLLFYKDDQLQNKFGLMEYYSLTDLSILQLAGKAKKAHRHGLALRLSHFNEDLYWLKQNTKLEDKINSYYSIWGHELTPEEKIDVCAKIKEEGYPEMDGIYNYSCRLYISQGFDAISKSKIKEKLINFYNANNENKIIINKESKNKTLIKK